MRIGTSLALIAVGLILAYAVDFDLPGIEVSVLGSILFFVGLLGLILTVWLETAARRPRRESRPPRPEPRREPVRDAYDPVVGSPRPPRDRSREETQVLRAPENEETRRLPRR